MDREQAEVYRIIGDIIAKMILVIAVVIVFFVMTGFLLWKPNVYFAVVDSVFSGTIYLVFRHYFPSSARLSDGTKRKKRPPLPPNT